MAISTDSFNNTPQAVDDYYTAAQTGLNEDSTHTIILTVMANDLGGKAKTLYSLDDGIENEGTTTSPDLLVQDVVGVNNSQYGATIAIMADGTVAYTMTIASRAHFDSLGAGEIGYDTFTYAIRLGNGTLSWATATVEIRGVNDAPEFTHSLAEAAGAVQEDTNLTASGQVTASDADNGATAAFSGDASSAYGSFVVDATSGEWTYTLDNDAAQSLAAGQEVSETFTVTVTDDQGATATQDVTITITGTNDEVLVSGAVGSGAVEEDVTAQATGTVNFTDVDLTDDHSVSAALASSDYATSMGSFSVVETTDTTGIGTGGVVSWTYDIDNAAAQQLAYGQVVTEVHTITIDDNNGDTVTQDVTITITGTVVPTASVAVSPASVTEDGVTNLLYTVTLDHASAFDTTVTYAISGTATQGTDYASTTGSITILAGATSGTITVDPTADTTYENNETVILTLTGGTTNAQAISLGTTVATGTITNDDAVPTASVAVTPASMAEDAAGVLTYTVSLDRASAFDTTVNFTLTGTATQGTTDYAPSTTGSITILAGATSGTITVDPAADTTYENNETVILTLTGGTTNAQAISLGTTVATGTITNDDAVPTASVAVTPASMAEDAAGVLTYTVSLDRASAFDTTVNFTLTGTATQGTDYAPSTTGSITILAGATSGTITVDPTADATVENDETVILTLTNGTTNGQAIGLGTTVATGTIAYDDTAPATATIAVTGTSGNKTQATVTFSKAVDTSTLQVTDFTFDPDPVGGPTSTPVFQGTPTFNSPTNTIWTFEFDSYNGMNHFVGTLTLNGALYKFADGTNGVTASNTTFDMYPAGAAGSPINLGLTTPTGDEGAVVSVTVTGVPAGWTINGATQQGDGSWTVQTVDPSELAVTTPTNYAGAAVLGIMMNWTNPDDSTGSVFVNDNVEAYPPGSPIFAVSSDDHLTASSAADVLVFAQPIAHDTIHNFDASEDRIDLIGFTGVSGFANLSIADDANGNAVITTSPGSTITVLGVHAADLSAANFEFNVEPVTVNAGTMTIANGAILPLGGVIENSGTIALGSTGSETSLQILVESVTLRGGGNVVLSDNANNVVFGGAANATLINVDNTISGAGQIGAGQMTLVNAGTIVADGSHALVIDTGSNTVANTGTLEASGSGGLVVASAVAGGGSLWANGGSIAVQGDVSGHGSATISGTGALEFGAASDTNVGLAGDAAGTLTLDHAAAFTGTLAGLNADDTLNFGDIAFSSATQISYTANAAGTAGSLVVSDGTNTAQLTLIGHYAAADFQLTAGADGSTVLVNTAADNATLVGTAGADVLVGTAGNDIVVGGAGSDTLTGGAGSDTFLFRSSDGGAADTITDFDVGAGGDALSIGALLQGYSSGADLSQFIGLRESGDYTIVSIDRDGAGDAFGFQDLVVLQGVTGLDFSTLVAHVDPNPLP